MKSILHVLIGGLIATNDTSAQFYPDSNATWCLTNGIAPNFEIKMQMNLYPDTLILGQTYQRINEYRKEPFPWILMDRHYVRSAPDGKGYAFLLDSMAEYLAGDMYAQLGDTVHNVLVKNEGVCSFPPYQLVDVVIDSVLTITNNGVTVVRHYVHTPCYTDSNFHPWSFFWQAGIGTSHGSVLQITSGFAHVDIYCSRVDNTIVIPPGEVCGCFPNPTNVQSPKQVWNFRVYPNPTTGRITVAFDDPLERDSFYSVYDAKGRLLYQRLLLPGREIEEIDLSRFGKGAYVLRFTLPDSVRHERVVVE